jgi:malonyl-CoA/methylmalonyl-CoA synthetase
MHTTPRSIPEALLAAAERVPAKPALLFEGSVFTYRELQDLVLRWARAYIAGGLRPGDRIALFLENRPAFLGSYLGAQLAGAIVVLVNTQYRQVELRHLLADSRARLVVADTPRRAELERVVGELPELALVVVVGDEERPHPNHLPVGAEASSPAAGERARAFSARPTQISAGAFLAAARSAEPALPDPESIAVIGYTSGTTGRAKGAMLRHRNLAANSLAVTQAWGWSEADRLLLTLPLFHAHGLFVGIHGALVTASTVDLRRRFDAAEVYDTLLRGETTMFFGVPTMYGRLIAEARQRDRRPLPLRLYVSGSAPLSVQTFTDFERLFGQRILERYGMTETVMNLTNPFLGERRPGTVGTPFPGQEARIVELRTRAVITDERPGEIQVRGPHVFAGYWERPDATAEAFDVDGWFNTGDLGWRSADGYYTISGRARELIITGGYNVYPREVEDVLASHPQVAEVAVFGAPDPDFGEQVVAAVVRRSTENFAQLVSADDLVAFCRDQLASYKKPRHIVFVDQLPRNALGKVQKHLLQERLQAAR